MCKKKLVHCVTSFQIPGFYHRQRGTRESQKGQGHARKSAKRGRQITEKLQKDPEKSRQNQRT